jgi:hypothetical protein
LRLLSKRSPKVLMHCHDFCLNLCDRSPDLDFLLAMVKHIAAGDVEGRICLVAARQLQQPCLRDAIHQATNVCPIKSSSTHDAGFCSGVERAAPEIIRAEIGVSRANHHRFSMVDGIDISLLKQHSFLVNPQSKTVPS